MKVIWKLGIILKLLMRKCGSVLMSLLRKNGIGLMLLIIVVILPIVCFMVGKSQAKTLPVFIELEKVVEIPVDKIVEVPVNVAPERVYFNVPLSKAVQDVVFDECKKHGIQPSLVMALMYEESRYNPEAVNKNKTCFGIMQVKKDCHEARMAKYNCTDLFDPVQCIPVGIDILAELNGYGKGISWTLMAYNGGSAYADEKAEQGITSNYAINILARAYELESKRYCGLSTQ